MSGAPGAGQPKKPSDSKPQAGGSASGIGHCIAKGCKKSPKRFEFCDEHFEHFKFGLVKKTGEPASDYEKKYEHYVAYREKAELKKKSA